MTPMTYSNGFLKDDNGNLSMMRLLSYKTWFLFAFMVIWQTITNTYNIWSLLIVGSLAFMPKVFQKIVEYYGRVPISNNNSNTNKG